MKKILALSVALSLVLGSAQLWALITSASFVVSAASGDTNNVTAGPATSSGDLLVACIGDYASVTATTFADSKGNMWTQFPAGEYTAGGFGRIRGFYAKNATVGGSHTFTASGTGAYPAIIVRGFTGVHLTTPADQSDGANAPNAATTGKPTTGITPSENDELVIACTSWGTAAGDPTVDSSMSTPDIVSFTGSVNFGVALAYKIQTTAGAIQPEWTWSNSQSGGVNVFSFKKAAGGGGGSTTSRLLGGGIFFRPAAVGRIAGARGSR